MKKLLLILSVLSALVFGFSAVYAQYYGADSYYYNNNATSYSTNYTYPTSYPSDSSLYYGGGNRGHGIGSYTIGCTTYYYNTRTRASMGTYNTCAYTGGYTYTGGYNNYTHSNYTYPSTQYCTYMYQNGAWYPSCNNNSYNNYNYYNDIYYGGGYNSGGSQNYLNCYYDQYGQYVCW